MNLTNLLTYGTWIVALAVIASIYLSARRWRGNRMHAAGWMTQENGDVATQDRVRADDQSRLHQTQEPQRAEGEGMLPRPAGHAAAGHRHHGCC